MHLSETIVAYKGFKILRKQTNQQIYRVLIQTTGCVHATMLQDTGHFFPRRQPYITRHYRFTDTLTRKRARHANISEKAKQATMWNISSPVVYFTFSFKAAWGFVLGEFHSFLCFHPLTVGKLGVTALAVAGTLPVRFTYAWWTVGSGEPSSSQFLLLWLHLPHFTPKQRHSDLLNHSCLYVFTIAPATAWAILQSKSRETVAFIIYIF